MKTLGGYYIEELHPNFKKYRIIIINSDWELSTFITCISMGNSIKDEYPEFMDLGGL